MNEKQLVERVRSVSTEMESEILTELSGSLIISKI